MGEEKVRVGIYSLSSCEGCLVQLLNLEDIILELFENINVVSCRLLGMEGVKKADVAIIEGAVMSKEEEERLKEIRLNSEILVAFGDCACHGGRFIVKDFGLEEADVEIPRVGKYTAYSLDKFVKVDYYVYGCPVDKEEVLSLFKDIILGKEHRPKPYN
ncbi:MAG: hypothetical protein DRJ49_07035, partial [Thermoprotei archaeon]